jgi:hypothetical protein
MLIGFPVVFEEAVDVRELIKLISVPVNVVDEFIRNTSE